MSQPDNKIREVTNSKLNEKGLNPEKATKEELARGFKILAHLPDTDVVQMLGTKFDGNVVKVAIAVSNKSELQQERLKKAVSGLTVKFRKGMIGADRNDGSNPRDRYYDLHTLSFDIPADKEPELLKTLAEFLNAEAKQEVKKYQPDGGEKPSLLSRISEIQNSGVERNA